MTFELRFLTRNEGKFLELEALISPSKYVLISDTTEINEIQTDKTDVLIRDKTLRAFNIIRRPLIVDHTGLEFDLLGGFPAGLTSVFYDKLKSEGIAEIIGKSANPGVYATTAIGYCDGSQVHSFEGRVRGTVSDTPRGSEGFQWDTIFIPDGYDKTYAELGNRKKNEISMRRIAFDKLVNFLRKWPS